MSGYRHNRIQEKGAKERRRFALERTEIRGPTEPRVSAAGPTSLAIKVNPHADMIAEFLARKGGDK